MAQITEILSTFAAWATSLAVILATLSAIFKPVRKVFMFIAKRIFSDDKSSENISSEIKAMEDRLSKKIDDVSSKVDANERDRLKKIIFDFGNRARSRNPISGEDFRFLQQSFKKYTSLGGNDIAHDEYVFVEQYYNESKWLSNN